MNGDWLKMIGEVVEALGEGDSAKRSNGISAYLSGRAIQTGGDAQQAYVYERRLTRPRNPNVNDR